MALSSVQALPAKFAAFVPTVERTKPLSERERTTRVVALNTSANSRQGGKSTGTRKSRNKFTTVRLPFENFTPVRRKASRTNDNSNSNNNIEESPATLIPPFRGRDVRNIGFRHRSARNAIKSQSFDKKGNEWNRFYLALSYIKLYRSQPEPEFVYLSDARIPPVVRDGMVRHNAKQLVTVAAAAAADPAAALLSGESGGGGGQEIRLLDESAFKNDRMSRSPEETYFKFRGEEILKNSGLSYAIVRVSGYNESPSGDASSIALTRDYNSVESSSSLYGVVEPVSRADVAQVCVSALLEPHALNKSFGGVAKGGVEVGEVAFGAMTVFYGCGRRYSGRVSRVEVGGLAFGKAAAGGAAICLLR
jgi:hypothetical protein